MDSLLLRAVLPEIRDGLCGRHVTKVESVGKYGVLIRFGGSRANLFVSAHPELSRIGLTEEVPPIGEPRPAPDNLSEPLVGAVLREVAREEGGRVVRLAFLAEAGRHREPELVGELIPRFANVVLVGNDARILWAKREFTGEDRPRQVATGHPYVAPDLDPGLRLSDLDEVTIAARLAEGEGALARRLPRGWGGGPNGPAAVFEAAGLDVASRLAALAAATRAPGSSPRLAHRLEDGVAHLFPADPGEIPGWEIASAGSANAVVGEWFGKREAGEATDTLLADLRRTLVKRRSRAAKALRQIDGRLADAEREAEFRAQAELLTAHLGRVKRGMKSIALPAFDGSGDVEIPLDSKKDGNGNVEALFKKARRLARGREELTTQRAIQGAEIETCDEGLAATDPPPVGEDLEALAAKFAPEILEARSRGRGMKGTPPARRRPDAPLEPERHPSLPDGFVPRVYDLPGGWVVWVGRNAKQNDELTHRRASQKDVWFHARGAQGSHTVLRAGSGKGEPPKDILEAAAAIAAWFSKARNSSLVPVAYTEKRYVRKPRKAPVGTALMMREKVVMVRPALPDDAGSASGGA